MNSELFEVLRIIESYGPNPFRSGVRSKARENVKSSATRTIELDWDHEYEYSPSGGVRVRKTLGNWNMTCKDMGNDKANGPTHNGQLTGKTHGDVLRSYLQHEFNPL